MILLKRHIDLLVKHVAQGVFFSKQYHLLLFSSMRSLVLACSRQRKQIYESENLDAKVEEGDNSMSKMTIHLNLIICLVARYFEQKDLADEY